MAIEDVPSPEGVGAVFKAFDEAGGGHANRSFLRKGIGDVFRGRHEQVGFNLDSFRWSLASR